MWWGREGRENRGGAAAASPTAPATLCPTPVPGWGTDGAAWGAPGGTPSRLQALAPSRPLCPSLLSPAPPGDGYVQADARGPPYPGEHLYVNTQGLDAPEPEDTVPLQSKDSPKKDLFDMRPRRRPPALWGELNMQSGQARRSGREDSGDQEPDKCRATQPQGDQGRVWVRYAVGHGGLPGNPFLPVLSSRQEQLPGPLRGPCPPSAAVPGLQDSPGNPLLSALVLAGAAARTPTQPLPAQRCCPWPTGPFEDALKLHECSVATGTAASLPLEDQWPSPPTRRAPVAPTEEQLRQEPWYHGRMSRRAAERLLRADGDFLVRDSVTNPGQYVLTGMHAGRPKHLLLVDPEGAVMGTAGGSAGI
ncbi:hypothetical protein P7K49_032667 [Saguinus oedipus]|uniref:SH2 domain-containing protein n=1 Tax=Saguinus oedipus TaxID=9490 RepID=A0ABQ9TQG1_SAGOE|nr:hypothetical protein P7K49_032667 [Saguinus oedipus]